MRDYLCDKEQFPHRMSPFLLALACFVLDNDQTYYAMIPEANSLTSMCGVKIGTGKIE